MNCLWHLVYIDWSQLRMQHDRYSPKGNPMSDTTSVAFNSSPSIFARFMASVDRLLLTWHEASVRNGDVPYFGL